MNANGKVIQHRYPHCVIREFVVWEKGRVVYVLDSYPTAIVADNALRVHLYVPNNNKYCFGSVFWARNLSAGRLTKSWVCKHCIMWTQGSGTVQWKLHVCWSIGKIAYVMNYNDRLVSTDNFLGRWIDVSIKNLQPKPTSCQVSIVFIALMLYFFLFKKTRDKLICLWKQNDILHLCYKLTNSFPSYDSPERQFHCFVFIFYLVDGTCKIFVERDCYCPVYDRRPKTGIFARGW